jgi:Tfp pilus assembly protein PilF
VIGGFIALLACLGLFVWFWRRDRMASLGFLWIGVTLAPVLNTRWMPANPFAERYLYLPSVGFCWLVAWAAVKLWRSVPANVSASRSGWAAAIPILLVTLSAFYATRTFIRNRDWRNDETLYRRTLAQQPHAQIIRTNLGVVYFERGNLAAAEREWLASLGPRRPYASTLNNLGLLRSRQKRYDEAISYFERALQERPNYVSPYGNLARVYVEMGRLDDAEIAFQKAVDMAPLNTAIRNEFGQFLLNQNRKAEAKVQFILSAQADPNAEAQTQLGKLLAANGEIAAARAAFRGAVSLDPFDSRAHFGLAALDERAGLKVDALRGYRAGLESDPGNAEALAAVRRLTGKRGI